MFAEIVTSVMADPIPSISQQVVDAFGGLSATARALGHRHVSTVHGWLKAGRIPGWRYHEIRQAAERDGVELPAALTSPATEPA